MRALILQFILPAILTAFLLGQEELSIEFSTHKTYVQTSLTEFGFVDGSFEVEVEDGSYTIVGCIFNRNLFSSNPFEFGCPLGTTGLIVEEGPHFPSFVEGEYWSMLEPKGFSHISAAEKSKITMFPPFGSSLPVSEVGGNFWEYSPFVIKYNVLEPEPEDILISYYVLKRTYSGGEAEGLRFRQEFPAGVYRYTLPTLPENPQPTLSMTFDHLALPESGSKEFTPFRFTNDQWVDDCISFTSVGPDDSLLFEWEGIVEREVAEGDRLYFSIRETLTGKILESKTLGADVTQYSVPANVISSGVGYYVQLVLSRRSRTTNTTDLSTRTLRANIYSNQSYSSFAQDEAFRLGLTAEDVLPDVDFDSDGYTNFFEYSVNSSPFKRSSIPEFTFGFSKSGGGFWFETKVRPHIEDEVEFQVQVSSNLMDFESITEESIGWEIRRDQPGRIRILTNHENEMSKIFVCLKVLQIP